MTTRKPVIKNHVFRRFLLCFGRRVATAGLHLHRITSRLLAFCKFKEFACFESKHIADEVCWELFKRVLKLYNDRVVEAASSLDFVFGIGKFTLKLDEIRIRLQVRIALGNCEK